MHFPCPAEPALHQVHRRSASRAPPIKGATDVTAAKRSMRRLVASPPLSGAVKISLLTRGNEDRQDQWMRRNRMPYEINLFKKIRFQRGHLPEVRKKCRVGAPPVQQDTVSCIF